MPIEFKRAYLEEIRFRYRNSTKKQKGKILDEFCEVCGYTRKHAVRILKGALNPRVKRPGPKSKYQREDVLKALNELWQLMNQMCSKSVNGNTVAFSRLGISIQRGDTDAERLSNTLNALSSQSGAAQKAAQTYSGSIEKLSNQKGRLLETIGGILIQSPAFINAINGMAEAFASAVEWVDKNKKLIGDLAITIAATAGVFGSFVLVQGAVALGFSGIATAAAAAWTAVLAPALPVVAVIGSIAGAIYLAVKNWDFYKIAAFDAIATTYEAYSNFVALFSSDDRVKYLKAEAQAWRDKAEAIRDGQIIEEVKKLAAEEDTVLAEQASKRKQRLAEDQADLIRENTFKAENQRINNANLVLIEQERLTQLDQVNTQAEQTKLQTKANFDSKALENSYLALEGQLLARQDHESKLLELQIQSELAKANLQKDAQARADAVQAINDKAALDRAKLNSKQQIEVLQQKKKAECSVSLSLTGFVSDTLTT